MGVHGQARGPPVARAEEPTPEDEISADERMMLGLMIATFDASGNGILSFREAVLLRKCTHPDRELRMKEFKKVCGLVGRDQRDGLDAVSLAKLYRRGGELANGKPRQNHAQR